MLTRYPDGIDGQDLLPEGRARLRARLDAHRSGCGASTPQREIDYFVCDDVESLLYVANLGTIPLHVWSSRVATLAAPRLVHPRPRPQGRAVRARRRDRARDPRAVRGDRAARATSRRAARPGCTCCCRSAAQCTYEQSRTLGELLARSIEQELPDIATIGARDRRARAARSTSTTCRTATASCSRARSARGRSWPRLLDAAGVERGRREARSEELHDQERCPRG